MSSELNPKQIENLALQPICTRPNGNHGIDDGIIAVETDPDADLLAQRDGNQVILQLVARFHRETVEARSVGEEVELQAVFVATTFGDVSQILPSDDDRRLTAEFDYFLDGVGAPRAQPGDYNISILTVAFGHWLRNPALRRLVMPVERAFFPQIDVSDQEDGDVNEHLHEAVDSKAV